MSYAKGDRVRVTIEGTVVGASADDVGHWLEITTRGPRFPIRVGFHTEAEGFTIERLPPPPEPLYVNAPEITESQTGDVVRDADDHDQAWPVAWFCGSSGQWYDMHTLPDSVARRRRDELPEHLTLLVRGGQVWPS